MFRARSRFTPPGEFGYGHLPETGGEDFEDQPLRYVPRINAGGGTPAAAPAQQLYGPLAQLQMRLVGNQDTQRTAMFGK